MKELVIPIPDDFTDEQVETIKLAVFNLIGQEIKKELIVPIEVQESIATKTLEVKKAISLKKAEEQIPIFRKSPFDVLIKGELL